MTLNGDELVVVPDDRTVGDPTSVLMGRSTIAAPTTGGWRRDEQYEQRAQTLAELVHSGNSAALIPEILLPVESPRSSATRPSPGNCFVDRWAIEPEQAASFEDAIDDRLSEVLVVEGRSSPLTVVRGSPTSGSEVSRRSDGLPFTTVGASSTCVTKYSVARLALRRRRRLPKANTIFMPLLASCIPTEKVRSEEKLKPRLV